MPAPATQLPRLPRVLVVGAGAVGLLLGGWIRRWTASEVGILGRADAIGALRRVGLSMRDGTGTWRTGRVLGFGQLASDPGDLRGEVDVALLCVRSTQVREAAEQVRGVLAADGLALCCQNGLGNVEAAASILGPGRAAAAVVSTGMEVPAPGVVVATVQGLQVQIGPLRRLHPESGEACRRWFDALCLGAGPFVLRGDAEPAVWRKLMYNNALNALATLRGGPYSLLVGDAEAEALQHRVLEEIHAVGRALGVALDPPALDEAKAWFFDIFHRTSCHEPSMLHHLRQGRRTEVDALNGAIASLGRRVGVETPANALLADRIRELESHARSDQTP